MNSKFEVHLVKKIFLFTEDAKNREIISNTKLYSPNDFLYWKAVVPIESWSCSSKDRLRWVSRLNESDRYVVDEKLSYCVDVQCLS
jgi:hypothetical protein